MPRYNRFRTLELEHLSSINNQLLTGISARTIAKRLHDLGIFLETDIDALSKQVLRYKKELVYNPDYKQERTVAIMDTLHQLTIIFWQQRHRLSRGMLIEEATGKIDPSLNKEIRLTADLLQSIHAIDKVGYQFSLDPYKVHGLKEMVYAQTLEAEKRERARIEEVFEKANAELDEYLKQLAAEGKQDMSQKD